MQPKREDIDSRMITVLSDLVRCYIGFIARSHGIQNNYRSTAGVSHYGFVPTDTMLVSDTLLRLFRHMGSAWNRHKFLDIGCGIGNVVRVAQIVGFDAYGLEYNKKIYDVAKDLIGKHCLFKGDMTSFKKYGEYDVLYYYIPIANYETMDKFAKELAEAMKCGAYVIPHGGTGHIFQESTEFESIKLEPENFNHFFIYRKRGAANDEGADD